MSERDEVQSEALDAPQAVPAQSPDSGAAEKKGAATARKQQGKKKSGPQTRPPAPQYNVSATVVRRSIAIGDQQLYRLLDFQWPHIHHALYYITLYAAQSLRGKVVTAATKAIKAYVTDQLEASKRMLAKAQEQAQDAGVLVGEAGSQKDLVVEVATQVETDVLQLVRVLDDYVVVMDSLWIGREISDDEQKRAHESVKETFTTLHKLSIRMRTKLVAYRRDKISKTQTKSENDLATEIEQMLQGVTGIDISTPKPPVAKSTPAKAPGKTAADGTTDSVEAPIAAEPAGVAAALA